MTRYLALPLGGCFDKEHDILDGISHYDNCHIDFTFNARCSYIIPLASIEGRVSHDFAINITLIQS